MVLLLRMGKTMVTISNWGFNGKKPEVGMVCDSPAR